jgi:hypothetical protein
MTAPLKHPTDLVKHPTGVVKHLTAPEKHQTELLNTRPTH